MSKRSFICALAACAMVSPAFTEEAAARSVSAPTGQARLGSQANCFTYSFTTGAVTSSCSTDFIVPLTVDSAGNKAVLFTSRATSAGASCRAVSNNRFGTLFAASPFVPIPVPPGGSTYVQQSTTSVAVPGLGVFFLDCLTNSGTSLLEFDYPA